jgi:cobalt-zinc-cadmium efflux system protein
MGGTMKTEKNILIAFILNLTFALIEIAGGIITGSIAIASDAIHDLGDSLGIGVSYLLEKRSRRHPDNRYTYGYSRYSVLGGGITLFILAVGSLAVIYRAVVRLINPESIDYSGMILFAVIGLVVNFVAAIVTSHGETVGQRAVNLHMLEDVLGWAVVLVGAIVMRFTGWYIIDPILSIAVSVFVLIHAVKTLKEIGDIFLMKTPKNVNIENITARIKSINGVMDVRHVRVWTMDGERHCATLHIVVNDFDDTIKARVREELQSQGILHTTIETECATEPHCSHTCPLETPPSRPLHVPHEHYH